MKKTSLSRRQFLNRSAQGIAAFAVAPTIIPQSAFGANDKVQIGFIALGRRACQLMKMPKDAQIVAASDVYAKRMDEVVGKKGWKKYADYRELLADAGVDAIITASPDHWHAQITIDACMAGKDVYVEKPMTLTIREGRLMVDAARKYKRIVQVGSQQRSMKQCRIGCELVRNGRIGKIHTVHGANYPSPWECTLPEEKVPAGLDWDRWFGPTQPRPFNKDIFWPRGQGRKDDQGRPMGWISFRPWSGGEMTGWGAHGIDIIQWALGHDQSGAVEVWPEGEGLTTPVTFRYADGTLLKLDGKGPAGGGFFEGESGEIAIDRGKFRAPKEAQAKPIGADEIKLYKSDNHMENFIASIRSRELPAADVEIGHRSTTMCHLGNIARWTGRKLKWDPETESFPGDEDANGYLDRERRAPWLI